MLLKVFCGIYDYKLFWFFYTINGPRPVTQDPYYFNANIHRHLLESRIILSTSGHYHSELTYTLRRVSILFTSGNMLLIFENVCQVWVSGVKYIVYISRQREVQEVLNSNLRIKQLVKNNDNGLIKKSFNCKQLCANMHNFVSKDISCSSY